MKNTPLFKQSSPKKNAHGKPIAMSVLLIAFVMMFFLLKFLKSEKKEAVQFSDETESGQNLSAINVPTINAFELSKHVLDSQYQIIDIRTEEQFAQLHLENSVNLPLETVGQKSGIIDSKKNIVVVDTTDTLQGKDLTKQLINEKINAIYLEGGITKYIASGLPTVSSGNPESTEDISKANGLNAKELAEKISKGTIFNLLDVRPSTKSKATPIESAINIPLEELEIRKKDIPGGIILVVDESPLRSFQAAVRLFDMNIIGVYFYSENIEQLPR